MTPFNQKALEILKNTAVLAQRTELEELIVMATTEAEDDSVITVMTSNPVTSLVKLITIVTSTAEQLGTLLASDTESLEVLKKESEKLQQSLAKL